MILAVFVMKKNRWVTGFQCGECRRRQNNDARYQLPAHRFEPMCQCESYFRESNLGASQHSYLPSP